MMMRYHHISFVHVNSPSLSLSVSVSVSVSRWWALALPSYICMCLIFLVVFYISYNMYSTLPLDHINTITDPFSRVSHPSYQSVESSLFQSLSSVDPTTSLQMSHTHTHMYDSTHMNSDAHQLVQSHTQSCQHHVQTDQSTLVYSIPEITDIHLSQINQLLYQKRQHKRQI